MELKIGQSFDVFEFLGSGNYKKENIGFHSVLHSIDRESGCNDYWLYAKEKNKWILANDGEIKKVAKLTITKIKI